MDFDQRRHYYNRCKPEEDLKKDDSRNVDFDCLHEDDRPRGQIWLKHFETKLALSDDKLCLLWTGLPGSGKSTELRRLEGYLNGRQVSGRKKFFAIRIDATDFIELSDEIDVAQLLMGVVHHAERQVLIAEGKDPDAASKDSVFAKVWEFMNKPVSVALALTPLALAGNELSLKMKTDKTFRTKVGEFVSANMSAFRREVHGAIDKLVERIKKIDERYDEVVIMVDSLEKLRGTSTNWTDVLNSAEQIFKGGAPYLHLPVHVIYTVPPALIARMHDIEFMPMIKIHTRERKPFEPGITALRELVSRRIDDAALRDVLGENFEDRIREAIEWSGGYPRDLVRILQRMFEHETFPLDESAWRKIRGRLFDGYRGLVSDKAAFEWLAIVHRVRDIKTERPEQREVADRMMSENVVLRYQNDQYWYDLHPAVLEISGVQQAIKAVELKDS